jgi:stringent starvation protein B
MNNSDQEVTSTRPYLIRALYEWCTDNGFTPYIVVRVNDSVQVPREYVKDGEIVLNASYSATSALQLGNDYIEFKARFGGEPRSIMVPVRRVVAIYARENGQGMAFPLEGGDVLTPPDAPRGPVQLQSIESPAGDGEDPPPRPPSPPSGGAHRPALKRVK